jgi:hypothetical protein
MQTTLVIKDKYQLDGSIKKLHPNRQTTPLIKTNYRANSTNTYDQDRQTKPKLKIKYQLDEAIQNWQTGLANDTSNKSNIHIKGNNMKMKTPVIN